MPDTDKYRKIIDFDSGESLSIKGDYKTAVKALDVVLEHCNVTPSVS